MVKKNRKEKAAPPTNRTGDEESKRRTTVEEADARWERQEAARKLPEKKALESRPGAIEEEFISYSPMSDDIAQEAADDMSVYEILPFEETMSESGKNIEDGISAGISVGDVGKPAGNNIENNRSDFVFTTTGTGGNPINISVEEGKGKPKATNAMRTLPTAGASTTKAKAPLDSESTLISKGWKSCGLSPWKD